MRRRRRRRGGREEEDPVAQPGGRERGREGGIFEWKEDEPQREGGWVSEREGGWVSESEGGRDGGRVRQCAKRERKGCRRRGARTERKEGGREGGQVPRTLLVASRQRGQ